MPLAEAAPIKNIPEFYVEGAIVLAVEGTTLMSRLAVDCVVPNWDYLVDGLEAVGRGKPFRMSLSGCSFDVRFDEIEPRRHVRHLRITTGTRDASATAVVAWDTFFRAMTDGARDFCAGMAPVLPHDAATFERLAARIDVIRRTVADQSNSRAYGPRRPRG